jgi:hypothetical protein
MALGAANCSWSKVGDSKSELVKRAGVESDQL